METSTINSIIGKTINDPSVSAIDFGSYYPVVNVKTLKIEGVVDGNYPETLNDGNWTTATIVHGEVKTGEQYADFAIVN